MVIKNFDEIIRKVQGHPHTKRMIVAAAHDEHALEAIFLATNQNLVKPILVGDKPKIQGLLKEIGEDLPEEQIIHTESDLESAQVSVRMINEGKGDFLMKGKLQTADLLREVVNKERGLRTGKIMSHVSFVEIPNYPKLLTLSDAGMMTYPNLEEKKGILENMVDAMHALGYDMPKIGALCAVETLNPKMPETVDAHALKEMNQKGEITGCILEGPISYDLMMSKDSAETKGYQGRICGDTDGILVHEITTGNAVMKALIFSAEAKMAGIVVGAKVPIVVASRGAAVQEKYLSIVMCAAVTMEQYTSK